jgi:uncharacterized membrane protein YgcG
VTADPSEIEKLLQEVGDMSPSPPPKSRPPRGEREGEENNDSFRMSERLTPKPGPLTQALTRSRRSSGAAKALKPAGTPGRRATVDAGEMEALLQELQAELPSRPSLAGRRDTIDQDALRQLLEEELASPAAATPETSALRQVLRRRSSTADAEQLLAFLNSSIGMAGEEGAATATDAVEEPPATAAPSGKGRRRSSSSGAATSTGKPRGGRDTADPAELQELLREMGEETEAEAEAPSGSKAKAKARPKSPRTARATLDPADLSGMLNDDTSFQQQQAVKPAAAHAPARRATVDPAELEDLINQTLSVEDHDRENAAPTAPSTRRRSRASTGGHAGRAPLQELELPSAEEAEGEAEGRPPARSRTPERGAQRRATVSPGAFQDLLNDMSIEIETAGAPPQSPPAADGKPPAQLRKSPRLQRAGSMSMQQGDTEEQAQPQAQAQVPQQQQQQSPAAKSGPPASARARLRESVGKSAGKPPAPRPPAYASTPGGGAGLFSMSPPPAPASAMGSTCKALRSCLSSKKKPSKPRASPTSAKKVVFGSPDARLFFKSSPCTNLTPMTKADMHRYFPHMQDPSQPEPPPEAESGVTAQNTAILAQWDEEEEDSGDDKDGEEGRVGGGSSSGSKSPASRSGGSSSSSSGGSSRRSGSKSPRPHRRQSLSLPRGSPGFMAYGVPETSDSEEEEEGRGEGGDDSEDSLSLNPSYGKTLSEKLAMAAEREDEHLAAQREDGELEDLSSPMDVSPVKDRRRSSSSVASTSNRSRRHGHDEEDEDDEMPDIGGERDTSFRSRDERTSFQLGASRRPLCV